MKYLWIFAILLLFTSCKNADLPPLPTSKVFQEEELLTVDPQRAVTREYVSQLTATTSHPLNICLISNGIIIVQHAITEWGYVNDLPSMTMNSIWDNKAFQQTLVPNHHSTKQGPIFIITTEGGVVQWSGEFYLTNKNVKITTSPLIEILPDPELPVVEEAEEAIDSAAAKETTTEEVIVEPIVESTE